MGVRECVCECGGGCGEGVVKENDLKVYNILRFLLLIENYHCCSGVGGRGSGIQAVVVPFFLYIYVNTDRTK